jgi:hypothetical protein
MKFTLTFFIFSLPIVLFSQEYLYVGTNKYKSTSTWECTIEGGYPEFGNASLSVAKKSNGAYFVVSVDTHHPLKGSVMIYLENGDAIKCSDTDMKDQHDGYSIGIYNLSLAEVEKMKKSNIASVRVSCLMYSYDMYSFTIKNYHTIDSYYGDDLKLTNLSASDISELMKY